MAIAVLLIGLLLAFGIGIDLASKGNAPRRWRILGVGLVVLAVGQAVLTWRWVADACWDVGDPCGGYSDVVGAGAVLVCGLALAVGGAALLKRGPFKKTNPH